jgi:dihydroorotate dehydrogenase
VTPRLSVIDKVVKRADTSGMFYQESFVPARLMSNEEKALRILQDNVRYEKKLTARRNVAIMAAGALVVYLLIFGATQVGDATNGIHKHIPYFFHLLDFDTARALLCYLASKNLLPIDYGSEDPYLTQKIQLGSRKVRLIYPIGLASGLDVHGSGPNAFLRMGFGSVELGTVSFNPEAKNKTAVSARGASLLYAGDSEGAIHELVTTLRQRVDDPLTRHGVLGVSVRPASPAEAVEAVSLLSGLCDFLSLDFRNISDPAEILPFLPTLATPQALGIFVKVSSELRPSPELVRAILSNPGVTGVSVAGAVTVDGSTASGAVCRAAATAAVAAWAKAVPGKIIIASGGVGNGVDALEKIEAGASLVQVYSALYFNGARTPRMIKSHLSDRLSQKGYYSIEEAIGASTRPASRRMRDFAKKKRKF